MAPAPGSSGPMTSLWLANWAQPARTLRDIEGVGDSSDVVVVGAGITGLTTAVLLARAGKRVTVVEAQYVGAGATGNTTGKVSLLQGTKLSRIAKKHGQQVLREYVIGNTEGRDWLLRYCEEHGLDVQREDDYAYAQDANGVGTARSVLAAPKKPELMQLSGLNMRMCLFRSVAACVFQTRHRSIPSRSSIAW